MDEVSVHSRFSLPTPCFFRAVGQRNRVHDTGGRIALSFGLAQNGKSLIDKNSDQPPSKAAFVLKVRRIASCGPPTVPFGNVYPALIGEYSASDEVK